MKKKVVCFYWIFSTLFSLVSPNISESSGSENWINSHKKKDPKELLSWLIGERDGINQHHHAEYVEPNGVDGFYNNPFRPELGAVETSLLRRSVAQYSDGVSKPNGQIRPDAISISETLMRDTQDGAGGATSKTGKTVLMVFFGQQLVDELVNTRKAACPSEYLNIAIPADHAYRNATDKDHIPLLRSHYDVRTGHGHNNPRQQLNGVTPFIDGNLLYGTSNTWTDLLRHFANGSLAPHGQLAWSDPEGRFPELNSVNLPMENTPPPSQHHKFKEELKLLPSSRHFMMGNPRGNENPMLVALGIVWFRWHNIIAKHLSQIYGKEWTDDRVFNEAKKWVIATHQHIVINHWVPQWIGEVLPTYKGYDASVNPQIDQLFQVAAMRFGHTLVPSGVHMRDYARNGCKQIPAVTANKKTDSSKAIRTCNSYWNPQDALLWKPNDTISSNKMDIDRLLMGMASQLAEREDHMVVEDLRGYVYGPLEFPRRDLMAINIQRGRDHGVPDYNSARKSLGLEPIKSFDSFINQTNTTAHIYDPTVIERFAKLYENNSIHNVDLWVGGLLETAYGPGQLFRAVLKDQFSRIRSADRFWYANLDNNLFTSDQVLRLEELTFYDVIMAVTDMDVDDLQRNPFLSPTEDINGQSLSSVCMESMVATDCVTVGADHQPNGKFQCFAIPLNKELEACTPASSFSYFSGSEVSFVITVIIEGLIVLVVAVVVLSLFNEKIKEDRNRSKKVWKEQIKRRSKRSQTLTEFSGNEWVGQKEGLRLVNILFDSNSKTIQVRDENLGLVRTIDLSKGRPFDLWLSSSKTVAVLKLPKEYDLVLKCDSSRERDEFVEAWRKFMQDSGLRSLEINPERELNEKSLLANAVTVKMRRKRLQKFFRSVWTQALSLSHKRESKIPNSEILFTELTKEEFAREFRMTPDAAFVNQMFELVDKDNNGSISFLEFLDLLVIFQKGSPDDKLAFIFNIYDTQRDGKMTMLEFKTMIRSLVSLSNAGIDEAHISATVQGMIESINLQNSSIVTLADFQRMMSQHRDTLDGMQLAFAGLDGPVQLRRQRATNSRYQFARQTIMDIYKDNENQNQGQSSQNHDDTSNNQSENNASDELNDNLLAETPSKSSELWEWMETWSRKLDYWRLEAFWMTFFTISVLAVFAERAYTYRIEKEHVGFRQVTGWGVPITRGAASAMMLSFSVLLLTTCRHVTTWLRETPVHHYVPFDSIFSLHQYAAWWGIFFAVVHTVGHGFNFYHLTTQPTANLACLFQEHFFPSHVLPKYHTWVWQSATGLTGVLLWIQTIVLFFFSLPVVRRRLYVAFWLTHKSYPLFYTLLLLHGASRLVQEPHFPYYLMIPALVFTLNSMVSLSRRRIQVSVVDAQLLPSDVTKLSIRRPVDFKFRSGQWVRLCCPALGDEVYHPFTISSPPQKENLSVHIRAVGPWTKRMRETIQQSINRHLPLPKLFMDGPYGEGHQEWHKYPVVVLIGAGIGVTPFSSILQDMAARISNAANHHKPFRCKKVYFVWVTRDQKQFEWMVDLLRQVEAQDTNNLISPHIFITQFFSKFDIRTVMLYVCERHFQKIERRSLFTGLRAVTHFGHPNFYSILKNVGNIHHNVEKIGVFSCGPRTLSRNVDSACRTVNGETPIDFRHHYEIY